MVCNFNFCEFCNIILGGIATGVIASGLFVFFTYLIKIYQFHKNYGHLKSSNVFDWIGYSMKKENGREMEDVSNKSTATVSLNKRKRNISVKLKQER